MPSQVVKFWTSSHWPSASFILVLMIMSGPLSAVTEQPSSSSRPALKTWDATPGMPLNHTYQVAVREPGGSWRSVDVYNVMLGRQAGEPLQRAIDPSLRDEIIAASMALVDFDATVEFRITLTTGTITGFTLSPESYDIDARLTAGTTVTFSLTQNAEAPRKIVFRPSGDFCSGCLHLLTNPIEKDVPDPNASNVLAIRPGDEIPRSLPVGKDTFYFLPGIHVLPNGAWAELDLGKTTTIASFDLRTGGERPYRLPGGLRFRLEVRDEVNQR